MCGRYFLVYITLKNHLQIYLCVYVYYMCEWNHENILVYTFYWWPQKYRKLKKRKNKEKKTGIICVISTLVVPPQVMT